MYARTESTIIAMDAKQPRPQLTATEFQVYRTTQQKLLTMTSPQDDDLNFWVLRAPGRNQRRFPSASKGGALSGPFAKVHSQCKELL